MAMLVNIAFSHGLYASPWAVKVFRRLNFSLSKEDIDAVVNSEHMAIERVLKLMKYKVLIYSLISFLLLNSLLSHLFRDLTPHIFYRLLNTIQTPVKVIKRASKKTWKIQQVFLTLSFLAYLVMFIG